MKRVLLTGGSGLLALNWAVERRDIDKIILGIHRRDITISGVDIVKLELDNAFALEQVLVELKPDIVVHTAALTNVEQCEKDPKYAEEVNIILAENIASLTKKHAIFLVHISTDHLFSGENSFYSETVPVKPLNVYAKTKADAEIAVLQANPSALVIRTNFFGWGPSYRHSFSEIIINSLRSNKTLNLFKDVYFTPVVIPVLINIIYDLIKKGAYGIYNVSSDNRISKYEFGKMLASVFKLDATLINPISIKSLENLVLRPDDMSLSNSKLTSLLTVFKGNLCDHIEILYQQEKKKSIKELKSII